MSEQLPPTTYSVADQQAVVGRPKFMITLRLTQGKIAFIAWVGNDEKAALDTYWALMTPGQMPELYERRPVVMV